MLKCDGCGHEWRSRRTEGKARQCSKCRSRRISEIQENFITCAESIPGVGGIGKPAGSHSITHPKGIIDAFAEDPQVRNKRKELEIARLDRQIAEERGHLENTETTERLALIIKALIEELNDEGMLDSGFSEYYSHYCLWCGAEDDQGVKRNSSNGIRKCVTCGRA